jgi:hypothetical protein
MSKFWDALLGDRLVSKPMRERMLSIQGTDANDPTDNYGYGTWIRTDEAGHIIRYAAIGGDQGVDFASALMPQHDSIVTVISNTKGPTWALFRHLCAEITG